MEKTVVVENMVYNVQLCVDFIKEYRVEIIKKYKLETEETLIKVDDINQKNTNLLEDQIEKNSMPPIGKRIKFL